MTGWCRDLCTRDSDCNKTVPGTPNDGSGSICANGFCWPKCDDDKQCLHKEWICEKSSGKCRFPGTENNVTATARPLFHKKLNSAASVKKLVNRVSGAVHKRVAP